MVVFEDSMAAAYFGKEKEQKQLEEAIAEYIGRQVSVVIKENNTNRPFEESHVDLEQVIHMDITYEE